MKIKRVSLCLLISVVVIEIPFVSGLFRSFYSSLIFTLATALSLASRNLLITIQCLGLQLVNLILVLNVPTVIPVESTDLSEWSIGTKNNRQ